MTRDDAVFRARAALEQHAADSLSMQKQQAHVDSSFSHQKISQNLRSPVRAARDKRSITVFSNSYKSSPYLRCRNLNFRFVLHHEGRTRIIGASTLPPANAMLRPWPVTLLRVAECYLGK